MTLNWELFHRDPREWQIPNQGVTKVGVPKDDGDWEVLKWELESFVCEGEYEAGLRRILSAYLARLSQAEQTAVWVSGFYGSGKSHLTRMLAELWVDRDLPAGQSARGLATLPDTVADELSELDVAGRRAGGTWAAMGKLGSGVDDSYRLAFMSVLFESAGLPSQYNVARFALKLQEDGVLEDVIAAIEGAGRVPRREFLQMFASEALHRAVLEYSPSLADSPADLSKLLRDQYPLVDDIADAELEIVMHQVLESQSSTPGAIPHTVIVLDEVQQYVGDDNDRLDHVNNITELVSKSFDSRVMVVATGQSALAGSPMLSKIQDRFLTRVQLSDKDVEQVTRELVLRKRPERVQELNTALDGVLGEISKHLAGSRIGAKPQDKDDLALDYPILPVRQRLWERMLRAVDVSGGAGQLRTQLRMTHEANQAVAADDLPSVVGGDYIYFDQMSGMLSGGVLSLDMSQRIIDYDDHTAEGRLRQRVLALIFMLDKLPREAGADIEVRATVDTLSELLVTDLSKGSGQLREPVEAAIRVLVDDGALTELNGEYTLQTPAGAELQRKYREQRSRVSASAADMSSLRNEALKAGINREIGSLTKTHGRSAVSRKISMSVGGERPDSNGATIPVWVQTEWSTSARSVEDLAREGGVSDPTVYVFLAKEAASELDDALVSAKAAELVLQGEPAAHTPEGQDARRVLESTRQVADTDIKKRVGEILNRATVRQGGGTEITEGSSLPQKVDRALDASLQRKFPRFDDGDHPDWNKVAKRAQQGNADALEAIGHQGDATAHPVMKAILQFITSWQLGRVVRDEFTGGEYGWPRDAVDAALLGLVATGAAKARDNAQAPVDAATIGIRDIPATSFERESNVVSTTDRLKVKAILSDLGVQIVGDAYNEGIGRMIERLEQGANSVAGNPPMPAAPGLSAVQAIKGLSGNDALTSVLASEGDLRALKTVIDDRSAVVAVRQTQWGVLDGLTRHAEGTELGSELEQAIAAVANGRQLLDTPDPVAPIVSDLTDEFRHAILERHAALATAVESARHDVLETADQNVVELSVIEAVLAKHQLAVLQEPNLSSPVELLAALDARPLESWENLTAAVPERAGAAMAELAQLARPAVDVVRVSLPRRVVTSQKELDSYLEAIRALLQTELDKGNHPST